MATVEKVTNPDHIKARKELYDLMWLYRENKDDTLNDQKFRNLVHSYSVLLNYYKLDMEVTAIDELKREIEKIKDELGIAQDKEIA